MFHTKQTKTPPTQLPFRFPLSRGGLRRSFFGFTLVELIVVIVILAILATIAFLSFNSYSASSRDSVRLSDINSLKKSLEMYNITGGAGYPLPDSNTGVTFSGAILWYQGTIGDGVSRILSTNLSKKPIDPLINNEYTYSLLGNKREFQIKANLESGKIGYNNPPDSLSLVFPLIKGDMRGINSVNAASTGSMTCYINGNFNGLLDSTKDSSNTNYILAVPSLILTDPTNTSNTTFTGGNLSKMGSGILQCNGQNDPCVINYNSSNIIYTGTPTTTTQALTIAQNLQQAYSGSNITTLPAVSNLLSATGTSLTSIGVGVVQNSAGINNLHDCPMGDDWNGSSCVPDSKTVLLMHFDGNINDSSLINNKTSSITNSSTNFVSGLFGNAGNFGTNKTVYASDNNDYYFGSGDYTIEAQIKLNATGAASIISQNYITILSQNGPDATGPETMRFSFHITKGLVFNVVTGTNYVVDLAQGNWDGYKTNVWYQVVVIRHNNTWLLFRDGQTLDSQTATWNGTNYSISRTNSLISPQPNMVYPNYTLPLYIGKENIPSVGYDRWFNGTIDEIRISKGIARWTTDFTPSTRAY